MIRSLLLLAGMLSVAVGQGVAAEDRLPAAQQQFFENRIRPVLIEHCYRCHSQKAEQAEGSLLVDSAAGLKIGGDSGPAIDPSDPAASPLLEAIRYEGLEMPPDKRLPEAVVRDFEKWIRMGAPDPRTATTASVQRRQIDIEAGRRFWSFQPVHDFKPPTGSADSGSIDAFVNAQLKAADVQPRGPASPSARIRRLYFDLTGLPPTVKQVQEFTDQPNDRTWQTIVDRLLKSRQFGVHWGRHWLDVVRYADSNGGDFNATFHQAWRYRNYVVQAFNSDKPFDVFIREQIAGDLLPAETNAQKVEQLIATGFLMLGTKMLSERDKAKLHMDVVDEQVNTVGAAFLGLTLGCARCHDHKFDPVPTSDYYALAGIFSSTRTLEGESQKYVSTWRKTKLPIDPEHEQALQQYEAAKKRLEQQLKEIGKATERLQKAEQKASPYVVDDDQAVFTGNWTDSRLTPSFVGRGYRHDGQDGKGQKSVRWTWNVLRAGRYDVQLSYCAAGNRAKRVPIQITSDAGTHHAFLDQTVKPDVGARFCSVGVFDLQGATATVQISTAGTTGYVIADAVRFVEVDATHQPVPQQVAVDADQRDPSDRLQKLTLQQADLTAALEELKSTAPPPQPLAIAAGDRDEIQDCRIRIRGEHRNEGDVVPRGFLQVAQSVASSPVSTDESGRKELADWIANASNPLTGRVIVNRIWSHLLGEGIVRSVDNFGALGERPTHPELLDHLAARFTTGAHDRTAAGHRGLGWSVKALVREVVLSDMYARSSADDVRAKSIDPENRLLWKANRRRLPAEALRDAMLMISGRLDLSPAESPVAHLGTLVKNNQPGEDEYQQGESSRRSLYLPIIRNELPPVLTVFDFADPDLVVGKRPVTNVPAQALFLMNSRFVMQAADRTAEQLAKDLPQTAAALIQRTYQQVLGRSASEDELERATKFLQLDDSQLSVIDSQPKSREPLTTRLARFVHVLFASTEFRMLD